MKRSSNFLLLGCTAALALSGCDFGLWAEITAQLRQPERYFDLSRGQNGFTVHCREPVIPRDRLAALGFAGVSPGVVEAKLPYWLEVNGTGRCPADVTLHFSGDYLQRLTLPVIYYDLLGSRYIATLLRMAGGASMSDWPLESVSAATVRTVLQAHGIAMEPLMDTITVKLSPVTAGSRTLTLKIQRRPPEEEYKEVTLSFRK